MRVASTLRAGFTVVTADCAYRSPQHTRRDAGGVPLSCWRPQSPRVEQVHFSYTPHRCDPHAAIHVRNPRVQLTSHLDGRLAHARREARRWLSGGGRRGGGRR